MPDITYTPVRTNYNDYPTDNTVPVITGHELQVRDQGITAVTTQANTALSTATAAQSTANAAIPATQKGAANGVATLDAGTKVPVAQVPDLSATYDLSGAATAAAAKVSNGAFFVADYGAVGNGKVIADAVLNSTTTLTSATAAFTSGDTGKTIMINGGIGATNIPLVTTITYVNATTVTLGTTATVTGTGFQAVYGSDDTAAINSAVTAAKNYALANQFFAEVRFAPKIYMLTSGPTQSGNGSTTPTFNTQIPMPYPNANGTTQKLVIALTGAGDAGFVQFWESTTPNLAGTVLVSTLTSAPSTPDATFGNQSVIGGPSGSAGFTGGYANVKVSVKGIEVVSPAYTNQYAFDFGYVSAMRVTQSSAHIFAPTGVNGGNGPQLKNLPSDVNFQAKIGCGLRSPVNANNADVTVDDFTVEGYSRGLYVADHFTAGRVFTIYTDVALKIDSTLGATGVSHVVSIENFGAEVYNGGISINASGGASATVYINLDAECTGVVYDVSDSGNGARGVIHWTDPADARTSPTVTGAANLKIINDKLGPGAWSGAPAVPASTTAQQNTSWRDAAVVVTGGTVSAVSVDGVAQGYAATGFTVIVPAGKTIALTYSVAPTWKWTLL